MDKMKQVLDFLIKEGYTVDETGVVRNPKGDAITGSKSEGYLKFSVRTDFTSSYAMRIHKFQAYLKFGDKIFDGGQVVKHINGIIDDNSYDNITLGDKLRGASIKKSQTPTPVKKIPEDIKEKILGDRKNGVSYRKLVDMYKIPKSTIMDFVKKQTITEDKPNG